MEMQPHGILGLAGDPALRCHLQPAFERDIAAVGEVSAAGRQV
jgi:hypothetical protein